MRKIGLESKDLFHPFRAACYGAMLTCLLSSFSVFAAEGSAGLGHPNNDVSNIASLQRGAKIFVNYCMGCHSAKYVRYNRLARDLG